MCYESIQSARRTVILFSTPTHTTMQQCNHSTIHGCNVLPYSILYNLAANSNPVARLGGRSWGRSMLIRYRPRPPFHWLGHDSCRPLIFNLRELTWETINKNFLVQMNQTHTNHNRINPLSPVFTNFFSLWSITWYTCTSACTLPFQWRHLTSTKLCIHDGSGLGLLTRSRGGVKVSLVKEY